MNYGQHFENKLNTLSDKIRHHGGTQNIPDSPTFNIYAKQQLINYIYSTVELSNFKYKVIEYENDLPLLLKQKHYVSANFSGSNCLLIFIKILNKFYSYLIDRKTLSYNQHQVNLEQVKIYPITIRLDNTIYDGTIFDGIFINNTRTFIITDIYMFRGKNTTTDKIQYKIMNLVAYLKANLKDDKMNNLKLTVNKLYESNQIETLIKDIPNMKNYNIKGLAFYPEISGTKLIFMLNNDNRTKIDKIDKIDKDISDINTMNIMNKIGNKSNNEYQDKKINIRYISKTNDPVYATFEIKKTKDTDVYKIYLVETVKRDDKVILKSKKMGIALIPTINCSVMCRDIFSKNINNRVLMKCKFITDKNKWEPIELDPNAKYPTNIMEVEKNLQILEEVYSDNE